MAIDVPEAAGVVQLGNPSTPWSRLVRYKRNIDPLTLKIIAAAACLPLLIAFSRVFAFPGDFLNRYLTFDWAPPGDRQAILYLLLVPAGALFVALFRLTFGIRVLGMRAILMAMGFRAIGILPSLALMAVIIGAIVLIRPWVRQVRLPLYARLTFILCLSVMIMIAAVLVAPWLDSDTVWRAAFFPVIILAMIAEGVAKAIEQEDMVTAGWRVGWTIILALLLSVIAGPAARLSYRFPELIVTQMMSIVLIAELFDFRLLEPWPARIGRYLAGTQPWYRGRPKIAVVRNPDSDGVIDGQDRRTRSPGEEAIHRHMDALREQGFEVKAFEGDITLLSELARFLAPDPWRGRPGGIVLNLFTGSKGEGRFTHVPAMLDMAGIPYTGPGPVGLSRLADRLTLMTLLNEAGVPVPRHFLAGETAGLHDVNFPAAAHPRFEPEAKRIVVRNRRALRTAVGQIRQTWGQAAVIDEIVRGRTILAAILGNDPLECLPLVEVLSDGGRACPAPLDETVAEQVRAHASKAFRASGCRDYGRIDLRLSPSGELVVTDVRWIGLFRRRGAFLTAATEAGYELPILLRRIVTEAAKRHVVVLSPERALSTTTGTAVVSLDERRAAV